MEMTNKAPMPGQRKPMLFEKAVAYRKNGYSYGMIREELEISKSTLSYWLREVPINKINPELAKRVKLSRMKMAKTKQARQSLEIAQMKKQGFEEVGVINGREFWLAGVAMYWAEGTKAFEELSLTNSDPDVIRFYVRWLKECCHASAVDLRASLHIYPDVDQKEAVEYWSKITDIPESQFYKLQVDTRQNKKVFRKGRLPYGTIRVKLTGKGVTKLHRLIMGWIQALRNCGSSSMVERLPSKQVTRVRFPSPAQKRKELRWNAM